MRRSTVRQAGLAATAVAALLVTTPQLASATARHTPLSVARQSASARTAAAAADTGDDGEDESRNAEVSTEEWTEARTAPGIVAPGAYGAAFTALQNLPTTAGTYTHVTRKPYNSDDPRYRDYASNSSGGAGNVTGRTTGLASDRDGYVYAAGANGGVWRSSTGGGHWTPIADTLPSLSSGDLELDATGRLWYATGEANTGATSYVGAGVFVLANPRSGTFSASGRVGGNELESTIINALRFAPGVVYAATSRGVWKHSTTTLSGAWTLVYAPNPDYLPGGSLANDPNAAYKNIANDVAIDPRDPSKVVLALGWRGGDAYNGFYTAEPGRQPRGCTTDLPRARCPADADNVGAVTFAVRRPTGRSYYVDRGVDPELAQHQPGQRPRRHLRLERPARPFGPWTLVADYGTSSPNSGSALHRCRATMPGHPGLVQPVRSRSTRRTPNTCYLGLEEVFETRDAVGRPGPRRRAVLELRSFDCWSHRPVHSRPA